MSTDWLTKMNAELEEAREKAGDAKMLAANLKTLLEQMNCQFPPNTFGMTKRKKEKAYGLPAAMERVQSAINAPYRIERSIELTLRRKEFLKNNRDVIISILSKGTAIDIANEIVFRIMIEERIQESDFFSFDGDDSCEPDCSGWNGYSNRCECGNRRVCWMYEGDFQDMTVYGEAW